MIPTLTRSRRAPSFPGGRTAPVSYFPPATIEPSSAVSAVVADRVYYAPALYPGLVIDRLRIEITTGSAGSARLGIYSNNNGVPGTLLVAGAAEVDTTSIASVDASFTAFALPDAWVWFTATFSVTPSVRSGVAARATILGAANLAGANRGLVVTKAYAALSAAAELTGVSFASAMPVIAAWKS